jgi:hypothetical protein
VLDASGTWNRLVEDAAIMRMVGAGAVPMTWCGVGGELLHDWRSAMGQEHAKLMGDYLPFAGNIYASFAAAKGQKSAPYPLRLHRPPPNCLESAA